jgi:hypothetical protein
MLHFYESAKLVIYLLIEKKNLKSYISPNGLFLSRTHAFTKKTMESSEKNHIIPINRVDLKEWCLYFCFYL